MKPVSEKIAGEVALLFEGNDVPGDEFVNRIQHFYALLTTVVDETAGAKKAAQWTVRMERGSTVAVFKAAPQSVGVAQVKRGIANVYKGLSSLEAGHIETPEGFNEVALKHAQKFANSGPASASKKHSRLSITKSPNQKLRVSAQLGNTLNELLSPADKSLGSLAGTIELVNGHAGFHAHLFLEADARYVQCSFPEKLKDKFHEGWLKRVVVYGWVHRRRDGTPVKLEALDVRIKGDAISWDEIQSLRGIYKQ